MKKPWQNQQLHISQDTIFLTVKIVAFTAMTVALFSQDLTIIFNDALQSETTSYLIAVPFLFAYLIYRKRRMLKAVIPIHNLNGTKETKHTPLICGILLLITAILLYWHGSYTFTPLEYHLLALPIFIAGLTLILFNAQTLRQLAFPIGFLIFLIPPPSEILYGLGSTLSTISSEASNAIVNAFGIPSTITSEYGNPTIIITRPDGTPLNFTVDIACSGIYSLIGFLIFAVFIAYIIRDKTWKKLTIILLGIPLIYALNIIRITIILALGYHYGEELALQIFHLLGGWILVFLGTLLLLIISEKIFKTQIFADPKPKCPQCNPNLQPKQNFCTTCGRILKTPEAKINKSEATKIAAITISITLLILIQAPTFALTQGPPIVIISTPSGQQVSTQILPQIPNYTLEYWYRDTDFEAKAKQDFSLIYLYSPYNESNNIIWVTIEIASTKSSLHRWEVCLISWPILKGYQPKVTQISLEDIKLIENPPIISRYFVFKYLATNETQAVLYWYETASFSANATLQRKYVKISLIVYPESYEDPSKIKNELVDIATTIANYWQPIKTWSQITMFLSQNGTALAATTTIMLIVTITFYYFQIRRQAKANTKAYSKLSQKNKQIIDIIEQTEKRTLPTLNNIATTYQEKTKSSIDEDELLQKLTDLEKIGIIKSAISDQQDEPILTWKTQIN